MTKCEHIIMVKLKCYLMNGYDPITSRRLSTAPWPVVDALMSDRPSHEIAQSTGDGEVETRPPRPGVDERNPPRRPRPQELIGPDWWRDW